MPNFEIFSEKEYANWRALLGLVTEVKEVIHYGDDFPTKSSGLWN